MTLLEVELTRPVTVASLDCSCGMSRNLACLGIHPGDRVSVVRRAPFNGPILVHVENSGVEIAVGRGMASRIIVEGD